MTLYCACGDGTADYIVTDVGLHRVLRISGVDGSHVVWAVGSKGSGPDSFDCPFDVAMLLDGCIAVSDKANTRIQVLDAATGRVLRQLAR